MPVFAGLFPEPFDRLIQDMLFELACFHAFARLRLHTTGTLSAFDAATTSLGKAMRLFLTKVCPFFKTRELPRETE